MQNGAPPKSAFDGSQQPSFSRLAFESAPSLQFPTSAFAPEIRKEATVRSTQFPPTISPLSISDQSFPSTSSTIQNSGTTLSEQTEALRESHNGISFKAPTRLDLIKSIRNGRFDQSLISGIKDMTCTQIKNTLLCGGVDLVKIASMLEDHYGDIDVKRAIETALTMKRLESMEFCDLQKVLTVCYRILGKPDHKMFLKSFLTKVKKKTDNFNGCLMMQSSRNYWEKQWRLSVKEKQGI